jgi:hypothetical protein
MRSSWARVTVAVAAAFIGMTAHAVPPVPFEQRPWSQLSDRQITDWGRIALSIHSNSWMHIETEHFIIHCFRDEDKIANRSEAFYPEIRDFFGNRRDLLQGHKSHIFAFHDVADWRAFGREINKANILGITRGNEFFYLSIGENGYFESNGKVQAHEMTHLIFNRFFSGRPPLWLNEGVAEYFGRRKTTSIVEFRRQMGLTPKYNLDRLFSAETYPSNLLDVQAFYTEATIVVDFLSHTEDRRVLLPQFIEAMINENNLDKALTIYGYHNLPEFENDYKRYRLRF